MAVQINQGSIKVFTISLQRVDGQPYPLNDATEIIVSLPLNDPNNPDTLKQQFLLSLGEVAIVSDIGGKIQVTCSGIKTTLLNVGEEQDGEALVVLSGDVNNPVIVDLTGEFTINKRLFTA